MNNERVSAREFYTRALAEEGAAEQYESRLSSLDLIKCLGAVVVFLLGGYVLISHYFDRSAHFKQLWRNGTRVIAQVAEIKQEKAQRRVGRKQFARTETYLVTVAVVRYRGADSAVHYSKLHTTPELTETLREGAELEVIYDREDSKQNGDSATVYDVREVRQWVG
jgi:hypothetical protein